MLTDMWVNITEVVSSAIHLLHQNDWNMSLYMRHEFAYQICVYVYTLRSIINLWDNTLRTIYLADQLRCTSIWNILLIHLSMK